MQALRCVAGIDVHKKMLAVVVGKVREQTIEVERAKFSTTTQDLKVLEGWLEARGVKEVVMESTGQYHKPVWLQLEGGFRLHLAQAQSNRGPKGRKRDFTDALRLIKKFLSRGLDSQLRSRCRTTTVAQSDPCEGGFARGTRSSARPSRRATGRDDDQALQRGERFIRSERTADLEGTRHGRR